MQRRWRGGGGVACVCCGAAAARLAARRPRGSGSAVPWRWWRGAVVATWQGQECGGCVKTVTHTQQATARREERRDRQNTHTHPKPFQREEERLKTTKKNCPAAPTPPPTGGDLRRPSWEGATSRCDLKAAFLRVRGGPRSCRAPPVACEVQSSARGARGHGAYGAEGLPRGACSPREALSPLGEASRPPTTHHGPTTPPPPPAFARGQGSRAGRRGGCVRGWLAAERTRRHKCARRARRRARAARDR